MLLGNRAWLPLLVSSRGCGVDVHKRLEASDIQFVQTAFWFYLFGRMQ